MYIVIAEKEELKLVEQLGYSGYPIIITGVGAMNVINSLKDLPKDTEILNIGYCGSKCYKIGEIIEIFKVRTYHEKAHFHEPFEFLNNAILDNNTKSAICYSSTDFIQNINDENFKEDCVFDMELAFIRAMFPNTSAIKVVSDNLSLKEYKENTEEIKNDKNN